MREMSPTLAGNSKRRLKRDARCLARKPVENGYLEGALAQHRAEALIITHIFQPITLDDLG
jgi:hypothetical protein